MPGFKYKELTKKDKYNGKKCKGYDYFNTNKYGKHNNMSFDIKKFKKSSMQKMYKVKKNSKEWKKVMNYMTDKYNFNVIRIERLQNCHLFYKYYKNAIKMAKKGMEINQVGAWHGSRNNHPDSIWKNIGFSVSYAKIGGCIWFAQQNNYSMSGYQYQNGSESQVFLGFISSGDYQTVKIIRTNIYNVYKDENTYPAYLVTYYPNNGQQWY